MLATTRDLQHVGRRLELVERQAAEAHAALRLLIGMLAEAASREGRLQRRVAELEARLARIEDGLVWVNTGGEDGGDQRGAA